jgi:hypothetical protein
LPSIDGSEHLTEHIMASRRTTTQMLGAAACVVLGMGTLLLNAPVQAQAPRSSAAMEADRSTAQPPASSDLDTNFWALVRDSTDPAALQSYLYSFPTGKFADVARQRIAALREQQDGSARAFPAPSSEAPGRVDIARTSPPSSPAPQVATENADLPRTLQRELKRLGCLTGEADGVWGEQSRTALKNFVRHAKLGITSDEPSSAALDAALAKQSRVCPLVCDDNEKLVGDRCVAVARPPRPAVKEQPRREQPRRAWAERPAAEPREPRGNPNSGKRLCFGPRPNELVTCP